MLIHIFQQMENESKASVYFTAAFMHYEILTMKVCGINYLFSYQPAGNKHCSNKSSLVQYIYGQSFVCSPMQVAI